MTLIVEPPQMGHTPASFWRIALLSERHPHSRSILVTCRQWPRNFHPGQPHETSASVPFTSTRWISPSSEFEGTSTLTSTTLLSHIVRMGPSVDPLGTFFNTKKVPRPGMRRRIEREFSLIAAGECYFAFLDFFDFPAPG